MKNTLIVPFDSNKFYFGVGVSLIVTLVLIFMLSLIPNLEPRIGPYLAIALQIALLFLITLFSFGLVYGFFWNLEKPAAILSSEGIWLKDFGFIPWDNIAEINVYRIPTTPIDVIVVRLKDVTSISNQASFGGKCALFWAKIFKYKYHITLSCLALENDEIVAHAKHFMN